MKLWLRQVLGGWVFWVGYRQLLSLRLSFLSMITLLSVVGVAIGVAVMIVVLSVMDGFEEELKEGLMATDVHIRIEAKENTPGKVAGVYPRSTFENLRLNLLKDPRIKDVWPVLATEAILKNGRRVKGAFVKGLDDHRMESFRSKLIEVGDDRLMFEQQGPRQIKLPKIYVGQELAVDMALIPGDRLTLISPTQTDDPFGKIPRVKRFAVAGIYQTGVQDQELQEVFVEESSVESFLKRRTVSSHLEVQVHDFDEAPKVAGDFERSYSGFYFKDWVDLNANLFFSLKLERFLMALALSVIVIVASFNIVTSLTMKVLEKKKEVSILKAMGATSQQVGRVFIAQGVLIGGVGVFFGILAGYFISLGLERYVLLPDIYYSRNLPVTYEPLYYAGVVVGALTIVLLACVYPSLRASKLEPLEGIRQG